MSYRAGVNRINKAGSTALKGDVTLTGGTNVTLTQSGQDISIASSGGAGGGQVDSVVAGTNIDVDATDPVNPIVSVETLTLADVSDITASAAEVNTMDGITSSTAELNILDGVTSTAAELNILDGVTSTAAELNLLDGVTSTTTELNYTDGLTSAAQTQLDAKAPSNATYIVQTASSGLSAEQALGALSTGIVKNTTTTGALSIAIAADFPTLNQNTTGTAANVTTNANLTGPITSTGNATSIASQTGTGTKFVMEQTPTIVTPTLTAPTIADFTNAAHDHGDADDGGQLVWQALPAGAVVQQVSTNSTAVATGTTLIPADDTIPQKTEGDEFLTLAITPKATTNRLIIELTAMLCSTVITHLALALFQDTTTNALAAGSTYAPAAFGQAMVTLRYEMAAGTTSATTFKLRGGGGNAGTLTFNGINGGRLYGAITKSSISIREIMV